MNFIITESSEEMSRKAAELFAQRIRSNPNIVLGLATGGTPEKMYAELVRLHREEGLDFSRVTTYNLDEYLGIPATHDQSYRYFMNKNLFDHVNIPRENTHVLNGMAADPVKECRDYEDAIKKAGGIGLQLLGIGSNGHIAFNEPGSKADSRTGVVTLTGNTVKDNARFFEKAEDVPKQALSMGNGTIMEAKEIILIADKESKAEAILKSVEGPVTEDVPASLLQKHTNCTFILDSAAAAKLKKESGRF
ncbi:MAG: glucosamine-6-phosphate deaminase [Elusimicrobia bacterium HGW-Elusimicrobia-2]|nr:MAG: glucosamine-6-phosphate deaminase [Elusimicrobia bacterium HGW-Elusimicrobia-2]